MYNYLSPILFGIFLLVNIGEMYVFGQSSIFPKSKVDTHQLQQLAIDALHDVYLLKNNGQLIKYSSDTTVTFYHNMGSATSLDVPNPFKPFLFYKDYQRVVELDKYLGEQGILDLKTLGIGFIGCIAKAKDDGYWAYDSDNSVLLHFNSSRSIDYRSEPSYKFIKNIHPDQIIVQHEYIYLIDRQKGCLVYDPFAQFQHFLPFDRALQNVLLSNGKMYGVLNGNLVKISFHHFIPSLKIVQTHVAFAVKMEGTIAVLLKDGTLEVIGGN